MVSWVYAEYGTTYKTQNKNSQRQVREWNKPEDALIALCQFTRFQAIKPQTNLLTDTIVPNYPQWLVVSS